jgi:hypothetical protein
MKLFDVLYYAMYRFGRNIGQPHLQAKACAGNFMPLFFVLTAFCLYCVLAPKWFPGMLPHKNFKPYFIGLTVSVLIASFFVYVKRGRGQKIISEYEKLGNQRFYFWLGAIFSFATVSCPVWMYLIWRATIWR